MESLAAPGQARDPGRLMQLAICSGVIFAGALVSAYAGIVLTKAGNHIASLWLANAVALAVMLRSTCGRPLPLLVAAFTAMVAANLLSGAQVGVSLGLSAANVLEIAILYGLLRWRLGTDIDMARHHTLAVFAFFGGLIGPAASAVAAAAVLAIFIDAELPVTFLRWLLANGLGMVTLGPVLLSLRLPDLKLLAGSGQRRDLVLCVLLSAAITGLAFLHGPYPLLLLILPTLTFAAFRLQFVGAATVLVTVSAIATWATLGGTGPIASYVTGIADRILMLQAFLATATLSTLPVAASLADRRRLQVALAESEQRYRTVAESAPGGIFRTDRDGLVTYVNPTLRDWLGRSGASLPDRHWTQMLAPHIRSAAKDRALSSQQSGEPFVGDVMMERGDGSFGWFSVSLAPQRSAEGEVLSWVGSVSDIDARRRAEIESLEARAKLAESNRLLSMAEQMAGVGHWRFDYVTGAIYWSPEVFAILGVPQSARATVTTARAACHPDDLAMVADQIRSAQRHGTPFQFEARLVRRDGEVRHVISSGRPELDGQGRAIALVGVVRDRTQEVEAERMLVQALDRATAAAEARSAFVATMSHEIRTPMTGVLGMIELLRSDPPPEERARYFETLKRSGQLLMTVLDDILDHSKIESGRLVLEHVDFDLEELIRTGVDMFQSAACRKGLDLSIRTPGGELMVRGDPVRLRQVLANLVSNAIKFTDSGQIEVGLKRVGGAASDRWRLWVRDTGLGMNEDESARVFDPFVQADASTTRRFGGTGLGLPISRRLIEAMGGEIGIDSQPGRGSTFWVEVPLRPGGRAKAETAEPVAACRPLSVLVAEDNPTNQMLVKGLLRRLGHESECAVNGRMALERVQEKRFDAVLMDMQMPEMDGLAATRAIRALGGQFATMPIIALTADASAERRRFYDNAGLTDFLVKPVDVGLLAAALARAADEGAYSSPEPALAAPRQELFAETRLAEIETALGRDGALQLLDLLVADAATTPRRIGELRHKRELARVRAEAHSLKGAALAVGASALAEAAGRVETAPEPNLEAAVAQLMSVADSTLQYLKDRRRRASPAA